MPVMTRRLVIPCFVLACTLVLLSVLKFSQVLQTSNSSLPRGPHDLEHHITRQQLRRQRLTSMIGKDLLAGYELKSARPLAGDLSDGLQTSSLNLTNATATVGGDSPEGLKVILMAKMRTGSTMLGEMFNQNPNFFYLFEPLHTADLLVRRKLVGQEVIQTSITSLLRKLSRCVFPSEFLLDLNKWGLAKAKSQSIRGLCQARRKCPRFRASMLRARCQKRRGNVAMKLIRATLENVQPLFAQDHLNVKILQLVRDPRGTANSRKKFYCTRQSKGKSCTLHTLGLLQEVPDMYKFNTVPKYCTWLRQTVQTALNRPRWLRGNYKVIRYEDLAMEPLRFAREIYEFLGLPLHPAVAQWVRNNTQTNSERSHKMFNTHKNSSDVALSWRNSLSFAETQAVEQICGDAMRLAGYLPISSADHLTNYSIPVMEPLNVGEDLSFT